MKDIGLFFLNASVQAGYLTLALLLLRLIFKKAPKKLLCGLWALVGLRLVLPVSLDSVFSLLPSRTPVTASNNVGGVFVQSGLPAVDNAANKVLQRVAQTTAPIPQAEIAAAVDWGNVLTIIWLCGVALMLLYALISFLRLRVQVREAAPTEENVRLCDRIGSPFILGVLRPNIYLPSDLTESDRPLILAHENAHLKRRDHIWKPLGFLLLTVYWFNPVLWVAYVLLCRDIELACDERVLQDCGSDMKKPYAEALLRCSAPRHLIRACPVAFGETGVKQRIKSVLNYKKPAFWVVVLALVASAIVAVCFMTTPRNLSDKLPAGMDDAVHTAILQDNENASWFGECATEGHAVLGSVQNGDTWKIYLYHGYERYGFVNGYFTEVAGHWMSCVLTMQQTDDGFECKKIDYPEDGNLIAPSIKRLFPKQLEERALNPSQTDIEEVSRQCTAQAQQYLDSIGRQDVPIARYNQLNIQRPNLSAEISNKLNNDLSRMGYGLELRLGTREQLEDGVRYVYRTSLLEGVGKHEVLLFTKEVYDTREIVLYLAADTVTGAWLDDGMLPADDSLYQRFEAKITQLLPNGMRVQVTRDTPQLKKGSEVDLILTGTVWEDTSFYDARTIQVTYLEGDLMETYPLQLSAFLDIVTTDPRHGGTYADKFFDGTVTGISGKWATVEPLQTGAQSDLPQKIRVAVTPVRQDISAALSEGSHYRIVYQEANVTGNDPLTIKKAQAFHPLGDINRQGNAQPPQPTTRAMPANDKSQTVTEPPSPPTTKAARARNTTQADTTIVTSEPQPPVEPTRVYTEEEYAALRRLGEDGVQRFPDLKNTTNELLFQSFEHMNTYTKFKDAVVERFTIEPSAGSGPKTVTLFTDKGEYTARFDADGVFVSDNQKAQKTSASAKERPISYYFPDISKTENVQKIYLYRAYDAMKQYARFKEAFVNSFEETIPEDGKIIVVFHTDKGDYEAVINGSGGLVSDNMNP